MASFQRRWVKGVAAALAVGLLLAGCASTPSGRRAPVEDRNTGFGAGPAQPGAVELPPTVPARVLPGAENAGKPGYYMIRPGDTLIRIGLESGQNWRDIARWNQLDNPNLIEVGQVLRVIPPSAATVASVTVSPVGPGVAAVSRPVAPAAGSGSSTAAVPLPAASRVPASTAPTPASAAGDEDPAWIWPVPGHLIQGFDETRNKGLDLAGKAGDPVHASADGRVVYAGAGLRGYGNLIILKHNNTYLTAYAHNQTLLVKEDQTVRKGQKIAEMGNSDADQVKLHFEIRRQGKPVDPAKYLPAR